MLASEHGVGCLLAVLWATTSDDHLVDGGCHLSSGQSAQNPKHALPLSSRESTAGGGGREWCPLLAIIMAAANACDQLSPIKTEKTLWICCGID